MCFQDSPALIIPFPHNAFYQVTVCDACENHMKMTSFSVCLTQFVSDFHFLFVDSVGALATAAIPWLFKSKFLLLI